MDSVIQNTSTAAVMMADGGGNACESCKNTPFVVRKLDAHHRAFRWHSSSGTQSAQSSPLPHRRLDKLEGVIRDKPSGTCNNTTGGIKLSNCTVDSTAEVTPLISRRFFMDQVHVTTTPHSPPGGWNGPIFTSFTSPRNHPSDLISSDCYLSTPLRYRRRVESDTSRQLSRRSNGGRGGPPKNNSMTKSDYSSSDMSLVMPMRQSDHLMGVLGESGSFASPVRTIAMPQQQQTINNCSSGLNGWTDIFLVDVDDEDGSIAKKKQKKGSKKEKKDHILPLSPFELQQMVEQGPITVNGEPDQSIVSGWLKFRDNKKVSGAIGISNRAMRSL